jgi:hypothetical protein
MTPARILELANDPDTPTMVFGTQELQDWTNKHRNFHTGQCHTSSGWYVVIHRSLNPAQRADTRVLSCWNLGFCVPHSHDVPAALALA